MGAWVSQLLSLKQTTVSSNVQCSCWRRDKQCIIFRVKYSQPIKTEERRSVRRPHESGYFWNSILSFTRIGLSSFHTKPVNPDTDTVFSWNSGDPVQTKQDKRIFRPIYRESGTVLDSGFHDVDSGFQALDSCICQWNLDSGFQPLVGFRNPWAVFRIPKTQDSGSHKQNFPWFRNPGSLIWREIIMRFLKMCGFVWTWPKMESIGKLSNINFQWTKTLYQNNLKHITFIFTCLKEL